MSQFLVRLTIDSKVLSPFGRSSCQSGSDGLTWQKQSRTSKEDLTNLTKIDFDSTCTPNIPGDLSYPCISYKKTISVNSGMVKTIIANLTQTRDRGATVNNMNGHDSIVSIAINNYDCGTNRFSRKEGTTPFVSVA